MKNQFVTGLVCGVVVSMIVFSIHYMNRDQISATNANQIQGLSNRLSLMKDGISMEQQGEEIPHSNIKHDIVENKIPIIEGLQPMHSDNRQDDDYSLADYLSLKIRILVWVMTSPDNLEKKAVHVYKTWAHKANTIIFVSSQENNSFPAPVIRVETEEGRQHLTAKTMHAFKYVYDNYFDKADWFMKADDDTFAIMENLRYFLADKDPNDPVFYGHHFKTIVKPQGYYSGGGGYVLSREALKRFMEKGFHKNEVCREDGGAEDAEFGKCMQNLGVKTAESYDERGASRFHCFNPGAHLNGNYPNWYLQYDSHGAKHGVDAVSDYAITFHYVNPTEMYNLAWYTYHLKVYGVGVRKKPKLHDYYLKRK